MAWGCKLLRANALTFEAVFTFCRRELANFIDLRFPAFIMPSKKGGTPKKKAKAQQLLISRFFTPAGPKPVKSTATDDPRPNTKRGGSPSKKASKEEPSPSKPKQGLEKTSSPSSPIGKTKKGDAQPKKTSVEESSPPTPKQAIEKRSNPTQEAKALCETKLRSGVASVSETREDGTPTKQKTASLVVDADSDTPATALLTTSSSRDTEPPSPTTEDGPRRSRKRRRLFIEDAESESECDRAKPGSEKQKSDDPDFEMGETGDNVESDDCGSDVVEEGEDGDVVSDEEMADVSDKKPIMERTEGTTLAMYGLQRGGQLELPRDRKRQRKFSQKIGRLEKNSFFLRRTGGGGHMEVEQEKALKHKAVKYTPLESQIVKLKKQHPDKLLVVECGYKYRMFDSDATVASKVLRVASFFDHNFLTASFPTHRLPYHVRRLVQAGYKVGVVSQSETAALKKASKSSSLFERKLSSVYTKGTITADGKLGGPAASAGIANPASYIMAVREVGQPDEKKTTQKIAIAAVDSASGEVLFDCFTDDVLRSDLESRLVAIEPVEVLIPKQLSSKATELVVKSYSETLDSRLERVKDSSFDSEEVVPNLRESVEKVSVSKESQEGVLSCLGALIDYLKQFKLELSMTNALEYKAFRSARQMKIGADVLRNFEVFGNSNNGGTEGSLIGLVNQTKTAFGSRQMRQWLSHPLVNREDILERLDTVEYLRNITAGGDQSYGDQVESALGGLIKSFSGLPDLEQGLTRISCRKCTPSEFINVITAIEKVGEKIDYIKSVAKVESFPPLLSKMFSTTPVLAETMDCGIAQVLKRPAAVDNRYYDLFTHESSAKEILAGEEDAADFIEVADELDSANGELQTAEKAMTRILRKLRDAHNNPRWEWKKVSQDEYLLEVPTKKASSMPRSWTVVSQTKAMKRFRPPEAEDGYEKVQCARETRDEVSARCWLAYLQLFSSVAAPLRAAVRTLIDLDCLSALAEVSNMPGYVKPAIEQDEKVPAGLHAKDARHPLTEQLASCPSYVPNNIQLGRNDDEIAVVISGPNYGGKSSYARMTALIVIMAQIGSYVPACSAKLSPYDSIHARMGSSDSMSKGMSSLMVELAETSRILGTASSRSLVVLDELGRGTSTHDGAAVAYSTLSHLVGTIGCTTLFVTHYPVLATLRSVFPGQVRAAFMNYLEEKDELMADDGTESEEETQAKLRRKTKITFLYKLTDGVASSSYGLNVARLAGIPTAVITSAQAKANELEVKLATVKKESQWVRLLREESWNTDTAAVSTLLR